MDQEVLGEQGVTIKKTIIYQDNMSSILLKKNGKQLRTKRMKHMDIQYLYVTKHVQNRTFSIEHCPTKDMLPDFSSSTYRVDCL